MLRFQNRRAKEKRLKKDPNKRWSNVMRTKRINQRKTTRIQKQSIHEEEEDSSNEGDKIASYDGNHILLKKRSGFFNFYFDRIIST